jgi:hypothetical protein
MVKLWTTALAALAFGSSVQALGQDRCIVFSNSHGRRDLDAQVVLGGQHPEHPPGKRPFILASAKDKHATPILLDSEDDEAIHIAAHSFAKDVERVTGVKPRVYNNTLPQGTKQAIMVGSAGSGLIGGIGLQHVTDMQGKWEVFDARVVERVRGLDEAVVIAGSDRVSRLWWASLTAARDNLWHV